MCRSEETAVSVGTDLSHYGDLEHCLEISVKPRTSVWDLMPSEKFPVGWNRRSLGELLDSCKPSTSWWVLRGEEPSLHGSRAQEHNEILWIVATHLLLSQAMPCGPATAWSRFGFLSCCCNTDHKYGEWVIELNDVAARFLCAVTVERVTAGW